MLPHWTDKDIFVDGVKIHYYRTGDGNKPPLVLAHGFSDNGLCWVHVARDLEATYDVILPDAHGHGYSARVKPEVEIDMAADTAGLIRGLGLSKPVLGGHSMGASTSAQVEAHFPGLVRALLLEDPPWFEAEPPKPEETPKEGQPRVRPRADWITSLEKMSADELVEKCKQDNPTWPEIELRPWAESKKQFDYGFLYRPGGPTHNWQDVYQAIHCPTLLITADPAKGAIVNPVMAKIITTNNQNIQVANIKGAGHNIRRENYPAYIKAVQDFLLSLPR